MVPDKDKINTLMLNVDGNVASVSNVMVLSEICNTKVTLPDKLGRIVLADVVADDTDGKKPTFGLTPLVVTR